MTAGTFDITVFGARGSLPVSGPEYVRYGGGTMCIGMVCGDRPLVFDAGTGILRAGPWLEARSSGQADLFFTHSHYDHVIGLPFFAPLYDARRALQIWSGTAPGHMGSEAIVDGIFSAPWFPVTRDACKAHLGYHDFTPGDTIDLGGGIMIRTAPLNHPGGATGYRVEYGGRSAAIITDTEHEEGVLDANVLALIDGVDLFFYDACYTDAELPKKRKFGHSTWQQAVRLASAAGVARVGLIHHAPFRTDDQVDEIERAAQALLPGAFCAFDGQEISL
ncbi:MBL fold metallo-hydrolase [Acidimangrovimonas sediminis]|uniref:MBL fold metallo-hydrolase n=1 Tax=Acidimangrovimonas sediminis TaxID=2056283 RepID=UPI0018EB2D35|nr:MBL fold metallo-hydrolase [Acidimangrovimonas sediminis]